MSPLPSRATVWALASVVVLALAPRAHHLANTVNQPLTGDAIQYEDLAWRILSGRGYTSSDDVPALYAPPDQPTAFRTPGLPVFAAAAYATSGRNPTVVRAALVLLNAIAAGAVFAIALRQGRLAAWIAGVAWALWPGAFTTYWSSDAFLGESLAVPLMLLGSWALAAGHTTRSAVLGGLAIGLAILTRSYLLFHLPIAVVLAFLIDRRSHAGWRRLLVALATSLVVLVPWTIRNYVVFRAFVPLSTQAGCSLWVGNNREARGSGDARWQHSPRLAELLASEPRIFSASEPEKSRIYLAATLDEIRQGGLAWYATLLVRKVLLFLLPLDATYGVLWWVIPALALFPVGAVFWLRDTRHAVATAVLLAGIGSVLVAVLLNYHDSRYRYCAEPFMVVFAAVAVDALVGRHRAAARRV
jgi:4-amino-4-deoxy-L-arabinose transferase-like glycosyltransferase